MHALTDTPACITLQLNRMGNAGDTRNHTPIKLDTHVEMPVFTAPDSIALTWQRYRLSAAIIHRGESFTSGHYQAVIFWNDQAWVHDDGQKLKKLRSLSEVETNCYLVCLAHAQI